MREIAMRLLQLKVSLLVHQKEFWSLAFADGLPKIIETSAGALRTD